MIRCLAAGLTACLLGFAPTSRAETPVEVAKTASYLEAFQNPDGGFAGTVGGESSLGATSSAVRTLKNVGGSVPDILGCIRYVKSCVDKDSGGFATKPGGKPDVGTTASGLMVLTELKIADDEVVKGAARYLHEHAKTFEEIRIAVAGLEAVHKTSDDFPAWTREVQAGRNADGTFGAGEARPRETGGKVVALLRMGVEPDPKEKAAVLAFLRSTQKADGGWSKDGGPSELETTYRIMRGFFMLKEAPDLDRLMKLVHACRFPDGGYGVKPGADASPGGTYFATTLLRWARLLGGEPARVETAGFRPLFNGKDLTGWEGNTALWSVVDGRLVGKSEGLKRNEFLATERSWGDFALKLTFRLKGTDSNSGVQFRSVRIPGTEMSGYQADIGQGYWGCLYDESRRNRVLVPASERAAKAVRRESWNDYGIVARGDRINLTLNGVASVSYKEEDSSVARAGKIAVQLHAGGPIEASFEDVYIQEIPSPKAASDTSPGFQLRTLKVGDVERKYTLYLPSGYDGKKAFPVVLFLHGSGERGEDGIASAQVGLGPAILNDPEGFPAVAIFPQAKTTWAADSDDAKAALAILDESVKTLKIDPKRVLLTGLSMGGRGSWEMAAGHPERFAAVVPLCGVGKDVAVKALATLPVWAFVGDADRDATVLGLRTVVMAIQEAGGKPKYTEYRDVGHNCWDRVYNNPKLIDWLLTQARK